MGVEIKGINNLIKKLDDISNISTKKIIEDIANDVTNTLRAKAQTFSNTEYMYIAKCEPRVYGLSSYIDVGLKNDEAPFELWKGLWYQNWGYFNYGLNFSGQQYISMHQLWFNETVSNIGSSVKKKLKSQLALEIRKEWNK